MKVLVTGGGGILVHIPLLIYYKMALTWFPLIIFAGLTPLSFKALSILLKKKIINYPIDICNKQLLSNIFNIEKNIEAIIHFAAYKAVEESVLNPLLYYQNNVVGLLNILEMCQIFNIKHFIFSSSCTVYGNPQYIPVTEQTPLQTAASPYGTTKQVCEQILKDYAKIYSIQPIVLRYFNPVGAHPSIQIGELPIDKPQNLFPIITQTASGIISQMKVFGTDYNTKDGTCIRDYIHVNDIANAHTLSLKYSIHKHHHQNDIEIFNLGSGIGYTVLEVINMFEKITYIKINYIFSKRRDGDVEAIYANNQKANDVLNWKIQFNLEMMVKTAWEWQLKLNKQK